MTTQSTPQLPRDIGGFQHLEPDVICQHGDILVSEGKPLYLADGYAGLSVHYTEYTSGYRVYRKMPCPRQGGERVESTPAITTLLPADAKARKAVPIYSGFIKYFPRAIAAVAHLSQVGNDQHNPGQPLHWDRSKSGDELDALMRHLLEADGVDKDGVAHVVKCAWRAMAAAEKYLEKQEASQ
jgi:hypothetical protein